MPGRRGKPAGVGPVLRRIRNPGGAGSSRAARRSATPATSPSSAVGPTQRTPRHPAGRVAGRARLRPAAVRALSPPPRRTCRWLLLRTAPDDAQMLASSGSKRRRNSHFRRSASRSVTLRSGSEAASGIPGVPPPEPTSTIGPPACGRARAVSASSRRLGGPRPDRGARSARVSRRARPASAREDRRSSRAVPRQSAEPRGMMTTKRFGSLPSLAVSTSGSSFKNSWTTLRSTRRHRLELHPAAAWQSARSRCDAAIACRADSRRDR